MTEFANHPLGLDHRVGAARQSLLARGFADAHASSAVVLRVAASVAFLGLAARLLAPAVGAVLTAGVAPDLNWQRLHWRPAELGVLPLAAGPTVGRAVAVAKSAPAGMDGRASAGRPHTVDARFLFDTALAPVLRLGDVVADRFRVPGQVVAGNVASALVGAAAVAGRDAPASDAAVCLVTDLLEDHELAGTGRCVPATADDPGIRFRRRSCCLLYRVQDAALCGDCVLHQQPRRPAAGQAASAPLQQQNTGRNGHQQDRDR